MKLTTFQSKKTAHKTAISPFNNKEFIFETKEVENIKDVYWALTNNFVLNIPLKKGVKSRRRKKDLINDFVEVLEYIVIDIDKIKSVSDKELCIDFFRKHNYCCIIGESRNPMNLKGVLKVNCSIKEAKEIIKDINRKINGYGDYDHNVVGLAAYQAPTLNHNILFENLSGIEYPVPEIEHDIKFHNSVPCIYPFEVSNICKKIFEAKGYRFHETREDFVVVSHPSEKKTPKGFSWSPNYPFVVKHWNKSRREDIWNEVIKTPEYKDYQKRLKIKKIDDILIKSQPNTNERYLGKHKKEVQEFLTSDKQILKIQSPMGTAKSKIIEEILEQSSELGQRVLFISNRKSLADDISKKYNRIKHYNGTEIEDNEYQEGDSLVVQIDSLHKFSTKFFDLVILDEFSTTAQKMLSIENHKKKIITQFFSLKKKKIVALDAIIFDEMLELFHSKDKWIEIINSYRDNLELVFFKDKNYFIEKLVADAKNQSLTFSCGSNNILNATKKILDENGISNIIICSDTPDEIKKLIYESFNQKHPKYKVIMYSPTLTVGVSNINDTKIHYHYDTGSSMDVLSSLQMTKRTRNAKVINFFLKERIQYRETDLNKIQTELTDYQIHDEDGDPIGISKIGNKLSKVISIFNTLENLHKTSFIKLLNYQFVIKYKIEDTKTTPFLSKIIKIVKEEETNKNINLLEKYKNMYPEEVSEITRKLYGTKEEEQIKMFEFYKDELKDFKEEQIYQIIQEEIKIPGFIHCFLQKKLQDYKNLLILSKKEMEKHQEIKKCFFKKRNRWYLNPVIVNLL